MDERTAIDLHLYDRPPIDGWVYRSSLVALRRDARGAAQRDLDTGEVFPGCISQSWLAATAYLVLLDQIGTCFRLTGDNGPGDTPIARAVHSFSDYKDNATLDVLVALRHALAHDYSLFNANTNNPSRQHAFNFDADEHKPLIVQFPTKPWSGTYDLGNLPTEDETTVVNLRKVGDLAEGIVRRIEGLNKSGGVEIRPPLTIDEFRLRYGLVFRDPDAT